MTEHLIRLRGGWLRVDPDASPDAPESGRRVTLPFTRPDTPTGRVRLVRSFGPPPFDPGRETLAVRLVRVAGLASIRLNGPTIARPAAGTCALEVPLAGPLPRRNLLVLDVDFDATRSASGPEPSPETWGEVALVISPREPTEEELLGGIEPGA